LQKDLFLNLELSSITEITEEQSDIPKNLSIDQQSIKKMKSRMQN